MIFALLHLLGSTSTSTSCEGSKSSGSGIVTAQSPRVSSNSKNFSNSVSKTLQLSHVSLKVKITFKYKPAVTIKNVSILCQCINKLFNL